MLKSKLFISAVAAVCCFSDLDAQVYSNEFLAIGVGARAHGMSGAITASTSDVYSTYWNPAGLTGIESPVQLGLMHAEWFAGVAKYDFLEIGRAHV